MFFDRFEFFIHSEVVPGIPGVHQSYLCSAVAPEKI